jgi:hypothetical protein
MSRCAAELCLNWTGDGCICAVFDLEPVTVEEDDYNIYTAEDTEDDE